MTEAERLALCLEYPYPSADTRKEAATLLRQLQAENEALRVQLEQEHQARMNVAAMRQELAAENEQLRSRLNCYNLGGWTDSLVLIKERDDLRVSVKKANDQAEEFERKWYLRGDELDALRVSNEKLTAGLKDAAQSLETISTLAGRKTYGTPPLETYMDDFMQVRGYANSRAIVAREVIKGEPTC